MNETMKGRERKAQQAKHTERNVAGNIYSPVESLCGNPSALRSISFSVR